MTVAAWCSTFFIRTYTASTTVAFPWDCVYFRKKCFECFAHLFQSIHTMYCLRIFQLVLGLYSVYYDREMFNSYCVLDYSVIKNKLGDQTAPVFGCFRSWSTGSLTCMWSFSMSIHTDTGNLSLTCRLIHRPSLEPAQDWTLQKSSGRREAEPIMVTRQCGDLV